MADSKPQHEPTIDVGRLLPKLLHDEFKKFCDLTRRDEADMVREVVRLFLADGFRTAFERLRAKDWLSGKRGATYADKRLIEIYRAIDDDEEKKCG